MRRKWSDWSECSAECVRTRHRTSCDDLIAAGQVSVDSKRQKTAEEQTVAPAVASANVLRRRQVSATRSDKFPHIEDGSEGDGEEEDKDNAEVIKRTPEDRPRVSVPADDEDYADEGDEDDEADSCANVEPSKTFEQVPCFGGLCPIPLPTQGANSDVARYKSRKHNKQLTGDQSTSRRQHKQIAPSNRDRSAPGQTIDSFGE